MSVCGSATATWAAIGTSRSSLLPAGATGRTSRCRLPCLLPARNSHGGWRSATPEINIRFLTVPNRCSYNVVMTIGCGVVVSGELLGYKLIGLRHAIDSLALEFAQTAAEFARTDQYAEQGPTSPLDWIRHTCHMTSTTAAACLAVGKNLEQLPESVQAPKSGEGGFAPVTGMPSALNAIRDR